MSQRRDGTDEVAADDRMDPARNVFLPSMVVLLVLFVGVLLVAMTLSPVISSRHTTIEVYTYLTRLAALWTGLVWLTASIYLSLICDAREYATEIWLMFAIGAMMSYIGVAGEFTNVPYWLGIRAITYTLFSLVALSLVINVQSRYGRQGHLRFIHRVRVGVESFKNQWRRRGRDTDSDDDRL